MEKQDLDKFIEWVNQPDDDVWEFPGYVEENFFDMVGSDRNGMCAALDELSLDDLDSISGLFRDILEKYPDKKMKKFISKLIKKLEDNGYSYTY